MAYTKKTWANNDVITAAGLNNMENGIAANDTAVTTTLPATIPASGAVSDNTLALKNSGGTTLFEVELPEQPSGITDGIRTALLQLASKVAYTDANGQDYYDDLYAALYDTTWQVSNTLTHCSSSNAATSVTKNGSYSATITAASGYTLTGATVSITMGGTDITSTAYSNGTISIASVTGALVISISAAAKTVSSIAAVYTQSGTVYDTDSLDSLKADLVVTATYSDTTTATVPSADYTLSGTLTVGTSTITVSYGGKTTTFNVTVSAKYHYDLTDGLIMLNAGIVPSANFPQVHTSGEIVVDYYTANSRRAFVTTIEAPRHLMSATIQNPYPADLSETEYYPIKIPADATGVTVSITANTQYISVIAYSYDDTNHYLNNSASQSGWKLGTGSLSFTAGTYQYLSVASKYNSGGTSYPTDPTALSVEFTK